MGSFYTNFTLRGPTRDAVQQYLNAQAIVAYLAAPEAGAVVVYDQQADEQDEAIITSRAAQLSRQFACPVLAVLVHDDGCGAACGDRRSRRHANTPHSASPTTTTAPDTNVTGKPTR